MFPVTKRKGGTPQAGVSGETYRFRRKEPLQGWRWGTLDWFPKPVLLLRQGSPHTGALPLDVIPVPTSLGPVIPWFPSPHLELDCLHWVLMLLGGGVHDWEKEGTWTPPWLGSHLLGGLTFHRRLSGNGPHLAWMGEPPGFSRVSAGALDLRWGPQGPTLVALGKASPHGSCSGDVGNQRKSSVAERGHSWASILWAGNSTRSVSEQMGPQGLTNRDKTRWSRREFIPG